MILKPFKNLKEIILFHCLSLLNSDLNMASKTQILLLLLVAVMIASYGLTNATAANSTANSTAGSLSPVGMVGLPGLLIYTLTSTAILKLFQLI